MKTKQKLFLILILMLSMLSQTACSSKMVACPNPTSETKLLTNADEAYCLLYPAEYSAKLPHYIVINPTIGFGDAPGDAWLLISTAPASGRTAAQIVDEQIAALGEGFNINRFEVDVNGERAVVVDGLPAQDSARNVFIVHHNRLYNLIFMPWYPNAADPTQLEDLYTMVMETLHFLPQE